MPVHERRQHFRIDDYIYFEYKILESGHCYFDKDLTEDLLGEVGRRYLEATQYFQSLDNELAELTQSLALKEPAIAHYLNIINTKIDFLVRQLTLGKQLPLRKVNISLGGMAFKSKEKIEEKAHLKLIVYTKPKMLPIVIDSLVVYSQYIGPSNYRIAVQFEHLTHEQEQLLSQHIMHAQIQCRADS